MTKEIVKTKNKLKIDLTKLVKDVRSAYGKDKSRADQISTGDTIIRPKDDDDFIMWDNSVWSELVGLPGIPLNKIVQICGRPDSGKSTCCMEILSRAQAQGFLCILIDSEGKFSKNRYDRHFKGNSSEIITINSRLILEAGDEVSKVVEAAKEQDPDCKILIAWDSIAASLSTGDSEKSLLETQQMAAHSKENGRVLRHWINLMEKYKNRETNKGTMAVLLINQTYANIGAPGQKEASGQKVEYFSSLILQLTRKKDLTKTVKSIKYKTGIVTRAKVRKNHLFDGDSNIAELDLVVTAGGIELLSKQKIKSETGSETGFEDEEGGEVELESEE